MFGAAALAGGLHGVPYSPVQELLGFLGSLLALLLHCVLLPATELDGHIELAPAIRKPQALGCDPSLLCL